LNPNPPRIQFWRTLVVLLLGGGAIAVCLIGPRPTAEAEAGVTLTLPEKVGAFLGSDQPISEGELALLPKDTGFAKKLYEDGAGDSINAQIVLGGAEKRSIHRPEICLPGQGWNIKGGEVIPVKLKSGKTLQVMKLTLGRPVEVGSDQRKELQCEFIYWFVGKDTTTPKHWVRVAKTSLDMLLHNRLHRWAYVVISSPVLAGFKPGGKDAEQTQKMLEAFIADAVPSFMNTEKSAAPAP